MNLETVHNFIFELIPVFFIFVGFMFVMFLWYYFIVRPNWLITMLEQENEYEQSNAFKDKHTKNEKKN